MGIRLPPVSGAGYPVTRTTRARLTLSWHNLTRTRLVLRIPPPPLSRPMAPYLALTRQTKATTAVRCSIVL